MKLSQVLLITIAALTLLTPILSTTGFGQCNVKNTPKAVANFNQTAYLGNWYEQVRDANIPFEMGECRTTNFTRNHDGTLKLHLREFSIAKNEGLNNYGKLKCDHPTNEAKCKISFGPEFLGPLFEGNYWVISTDYLNYAIVYSCTEVFGVHFTEYVWVLTREVNPAPEVIDRLEQDVIALGYPEELLKRTWHGENCVYANTIVEPSL